jgi:hypothetical protein
VRGGGWGDGHADVTARLLNIVLVCLSGTWFAQEGGKQIRTNVMMSGSLKMCMASFGGSN